ncbi:MAG: glycosyltransferase [Candidatus Pacearchaeota archaeon]|jgi:glycosyltransferase involved in cell wall biosynthesis
MRLSIVIPAYNEEKRIPKTLEAYYTFFTNKLKKDFEIIVVPNNCKDNTLDIVKEFANKKDNIRIHNIPYYVGKGGAVIEGFKLAKGDLIGFTDADNSTNPENFYKLFLNIGNFDGIIASRRKKGAIVIPKRRFVRDMLSLAFNLYANLLFNFKFKDTQCGAKIFTKKTTSILTKKSTEKGWVFDLDLLYICKKNRLKIKECPIFWKDSIGSKLTLKDEMKSAFNVLKYRVKNI